jgi:hypothetical protein
MDSMCNDVLLMIFSFCSSKDILHVARVSQRFNAIVSYGIQKRSFVNKKLRLYQRSKSVQEKVFFDLSFNHIVFNLLDSHGFIITMDDFLTKVRFIFFHGKILDYKFFCDCDPLCIRKFAYIYNDELIICILYKDLKFSVSINLKTLKTDIDVISRDDTILDDYFGKGRYFFRTFENCQQSQDQLVLIEKEDCDRKFFIVSVVDKIITKIEKILCPLRNFAKSTNRIPFGPHFLLIIDGKHGPCRQVVYNVTNKVTKPLDKIEYLLSAYYLRLTSLTQNNRYFVGCPGVWFELIELEKTWDAIQISCQEGDNYPVICEKDGLFFFQTTK